MKRKGWIGFAVCCVLAAPAALTAQDGGAHEVHEAAQDWLALVDARDFGASWEAAARSFQSAVAPEAWSAQLTAGRAEVGDVEDRELVQSQAMTDPPGAPAGEYMHLIYEGTFSGAGGLKENLILVRDGDRGWRVTGYFIEPAG